jgi:large conductance mechanosensitive channel
MKNFLKEFKDFIATGNMIELAVAVILGTAVGAVIKAFTDGIIMQMVAAVFGKPNFDDVTITLRHDVGKDPLDPTKAIDAVLKIGTFINTVISLVMTGLVLFLLIKAYNRMKRRNAVETPDRGPSEIELLTEIRDALRQR